MGVDFEKCENWEIAVPYQKNEDSAHRKVIENFANAILHGEELIAQAAEGINSVSMGNAIMLSHFEEKTITLPINGDAYEAKLLDLIESSTFKKNH